MPKKSDLLLSAFWVLAIALETALRPELWHRPLSVAVTLVFAVALTFRRTRPLLTAALPFSFAAVVTFSDVMRGLPEVGPNTGLCCVLLVYSLGRYGRNRDVAIGLLPIAATYAASLLRPEVQTWDEIIGGGAFLLLFLSIGVTVRYRMNAQRQDLEHAKLKEREQLARELHDSVAHHITAITIQAQAARAVLAANPSAAETALQAIESESRRTLAELREIVSALRDDDTPFSPGRIADISSFARGGSPTVKIELAGNLDGLPTSVERAVYRLAQETITNATKHAKNATVIAISVIAEGNTIRFHATDDGTTSTQRHNPGFGLVGMAERAALLGGTFTAGPTSGGWKVDATLPRTGQP